MNPLQNSQHNHDTAKHDNTIIPWLGERLQQLQCISNRVAAVFYHVIDMLIL